MRSHNPSFCALVSPGVKMSILERLFGTSRKRQPKGAPSGAPSPAGFLAADFNTQLFQDLSGAEAANKVTAHEVQVLDVRYEYEYRDHHIPDAVLIPLPQLYERFREIDPAKPTLVVCEHGLRSLNACNFLGNHGFRQLYNLLGGMSVYPGPQEGPSTG
jgi:rhodanese-related sulfurtransferase